MTTRRIPCTTLAGALVAVALAGCASFSPDGGLSDVSRLAGERIGQKVQFSLSRQSSAEAESANRLLSRTLNADTAVPLALANSKSLQASLAELGVAEADLVQTGRMRNPGFSFGHMRDGDVEIERSIMFDLVGLLSIPVRSGIEQRRFEQAKLQAATSAVQLAADTRRAYFNAVAAQQTMRYREQVRESADAGAELARRLAKVGNLSKLDHAREQVFYADATAQLARARHHATATREQLARLLGLPAATDIKLPERLPDLPKSPDQMRDAEQLAMSQRLDVQMAALDAKATASALGLSKATGFINVFHAGYTNKSETGAPRANGYEIELELPIFDWGRSRTAKAEALYMQSVHRAADIAVRARSQVREAYSAYRTTYDLARHYRDEVVPLRKTISEEVLLRYNGMLASVFELLTDARDQIISVNAAIEAQRDFWIAETDLQAAINGSGFVGVQLRNAAPAAISAGH
jgi:outer membrane protein TolC